jgi:hypothetical protein
MFSFIIIVIEIYCLELYSFVNVSNLEAIWEHLVIGETSDMCYWDLIRGN